MLNVANAPVTLLLYISQGIVRGVDGGVGSSEPPSGRTILDL